MAHRVRSHGKAQPAAEADRRPCVPGARQSVGARARLREPAARHAPLARRRGRPRQLCRPRRGDRTDHATAWYFRRSSVRRPLSRSSRCSSWLTAPSFRPINPRTCRSGAAQSGAIRCATLLDAEVAGGDAAALRRADRPRRQHAAAARHLSGLQRADHPQWAGRPRAGHGALGHADPAAVPGGQEGRSRRHQHPADDLVALAGVARTRASLPRALHQLRRERDLARRLAAAGLVRLRRKPAARLLRRHLGDLDLGAEGQGGAGERRSLRLPDLGAECGGRGDPPEGDAGDPDRARRVGDRGSRALGRG